MAAVFHDALGRVRSGWVVVTFAAVAALLYGALMVGLALARLEARPPFRLDDWRLGLSSLALLFAAVGATLVCRAAFGLAPALFGPRGGQRFLRGALAAGALLLVAGLLPVAAGAATVAPGPDGPLALLAAGALQLFTVGPTSVGEELLLRGVAFEQLGRGTRPAFAVLASGAAFGLMHLGNPEVSLLAALNIGLVGVWFGAMVWRTGSLWTSIGLHLAWNLCEGFMLGLPVSGVPPGAALLHVASPPAGFWGGGAFGPEASGLTAALLCAAAGATFFWKPREQAPSASC